jgi:hypothetical protein
MAEAESLRQVAQSRAPFSAWVGIVFLFMIFGLIVLAVVGPSPRTDNYEQTRAKKRLESLKTLREEDAKALTTYAWVDKAKGSAHIPIARAMELSVKELAQKKPAPAYAIATPAPAAPAAPAASGSPAPAAPASAPAAGPANTPASATSSHTGPTPFPKAKENEGPDSENRNQPAAANNPPNAKPGTQPGASATPQASPAPPTGKPAVSPTGTPGKTGMNTWNFLPIERRDEVVSSPISGRHKVLPSRLFLKFYGCC